MIDKLRELIQIKRNIGIDYYSRRSRGESYTCSRDKMLRVYRAQGMVRRPQKRSRIPAQLPNRFYQSEYLNEIWSMDFMSDSLTDGRTFRVLSVRDDYNRECLLTQGSLSFPAERVVRRLEEREARQSDNISIVATCIMSLNTDSLLSKTTSVARLNSSDPLELTIDITSITAGSEYISRCISISGCTKKELSSGRSMKYDDERVLDQIL